jgi:hypothetical protein
VTLPLAVALVVGIAGTVIVITALGRQQRR